MNAVPIHRVAEMLLHFAWQGLAIALVTWALMTLARRSTTRYTIGCAGLVAMFVAPLVTLAILNRTTPPSAAAPIVAAQRQNEPSATIEVPRSTMIAAPIAPVTTWRDRLAPIAVVTWLCGVTLIGIRHAIGFAGISRLRRSATRVVDAALLDRLTRIASLLRLKQSVAILSTFDLDAPAVIGWLRPTILWPASLMIGLTPTQLDGLLAHELAHIRRHDYFVNLLQTLVETLGFYHPCVWWLSRRVRQEREHCCDDVAADFLGNRVDYAEALAATETRRQRASLIVGSNGGSLVKRIRRLLKSPAPHRVWPLTPSVGTAICFVALGLLLSFTWRAAAQNASATRPATLPSIEGRTRPFLGKDLKLRIAATELAHHRTALAQSERMPATFRDKFPTDAVRTLIADLERQVATRVDELTAHPESAANGDWLSSYYIGGHVQRTGAYEMGLDGKVTTLVSAFTEAWPEEKDSGGKPLADGWLEIVTRYEPTKEYAIAIPIAEVLNGTFDLPLLPNDAIRAGILIAPPTTQAAAAQPAVPTAPVAVKDDYRIEPDDLLEITIADLQGPGTVMQDRKRVSASGKIALPYLGQIDVVGKTTTQVLETIQKAYADAQILPHAGASVVVVESSTPKVRPFAEMMADSTNDFQAKIDALTKEVAALRVQLDAKNDSRPKPNSPEALLAANEPFFARLLTERDTILLDLARLKSVQGENSPAVVKMRESLRALSEQIDAISKQLIKSGAAAPKTGPYYISGIVTRPGVYELKGDRVSVLQALIAAGHNVPQSVGVHIARRWPDPAKEEKLTVEVNLTNGKGNDLEVRPGDTLVVGPMTEDLVPTTQPATAP